MSNSAKFYLVYCLASCGYLSVAAIGGWQGLSFATSGDSTQHHNSSYGHTYSSGGYSGRTSGGFGGGGK